MSQEPTGITPPTPTTPTPTTPTTETPTPKSPTTTSDDRNRLTVGIKAVLIGVFGIIAILVVGVIGVQMFGDKAVNVGTIASPAIAAVASITAAYFGISLGQEGTKAATETATAATKTAADANKAAGDAKAAAAATKGVALGLVHAGILTGGPDAPGGGVSDPPFEGIQGNPAPQFGQNLVDPKGPEVFEGLIPDRPRGRALTPDDLDELIRRASS